MTRNHESIGADVSDGELMEKVQKGHLPAYDELVRRYQKKVYAITYGMTRHHSDADDLAQETFIRAYQACQRFQAGYAFHTWLFRIAVNLCINHLKKKKRRRETTLEDQSDPIEFVPSPNNPGLEMEQKELGTRIETAIHQLSPKLRSVIVLRSTEDMPYEEIARILRISKGTVMSRLNRAREKLKVLLKEFMNDSLKR
jgi:RNA polymerase sigma-70 factor, ECF subfamily